MHMLQSFTYPVCHTSNPSCWEESSSIYTQLSCKWGLSFHRQREFGDATQIAWWVLRAKTNEFEKAQSSYQWQLPYVQAWACSCPSGLHWACSTCRRLSERRNSTAEREPGLRWRGWPSALSPAPCPERKAGWQQPAPLGHMQLVLWLRVHSDAPSASPPQTEHPNQTGVDTDKCLCDGHPETDLKQKHGRKITPGEWIFIRCSLTFASS